MMGNVFLLNTYNTPLIYFFAKANTTALSFDTLLRRFFVCFEMKMIFQMDDDDAKKNVPVHSTTPHHKLYIFCRREKRNKAAAKVQLQCGGFSKFETFTVGMWHHWAKGLSSSVIIKYKK